MPLVFLSELPEPTLAPAAQVVNPPMVESPRPRSIFEALQPPLFHPRTPPALLAAYRPVLAAAAAGQIRTDQLVFLRGITVDLWATLPSPNGYSPLVDLLPALWADRQHLTVMVAAVDPNALSPLVAALPLAVALEILDAAQAERLDQAIDAFETTDERAAIQNEPSVESLPDSGKKTAAA